MKNKITTVFFAMLLLALSVLTASADQEGNARWCNIDNDGCYLIEADGSHSYMYFWSEAARKHYMGDITKPYENVVTRYYSTDGKHPLEPAPEPIVYKSNIKKKTQELTDPVLTLLEVSLDDFIDLIFPNGAAIFDGVLLVTDLMQTYEGETPHFFSLETAETEVLIPVYAPGINFDSENFQIMISDFSGQHQAEMADHEKALFFGDGNEVKSSYLIPSQKNDDLMNGMLTEIVEEQFVFLGYVSAGGVGVSVNPDEHEMIANKLDLKGEENQKTGGEPGEQQNGTSDYRSGAASDSRQGEDSDGNSSLAINVGNNSFSRSYTPEEKKRTNLVLEMNNGSGGTVQQYESELNKELNKSGNGSVFRSNDWTGSDSVTGYNGSNSWYNGVLKLKKGAVIIQDNAGMLSGRVEIGDSGSYSGNVDNNNSNSSDGPVSAHPTEFEWQGGSKNKNNKPDIYMNGNSALFYNLSGNGTGNRIFSYYGNLTGTGQDRLIFEHGEVRFKGDTGGFKGNIDIANGAKFEVRSSDSLSGGTYEGKFPNAHIWQVFEGETNNNGNNAENDPDNIENIPLQENIVLENGTIDPGPGTGFGEVGKILSGAVIEVNDRNPVEDINITGVLVASDNSVKNTSISGGILILNRNVTTKQVDVG